MNPLSNLFASPTVCEFLLSKKWQNRFSNQTLRRGHNLHKDGKVLEVNHFIGNKKDFMFCSLVQGTRAQPYKTDVIGIYEGGHWISWGNCNCPVRGDCKHSAALFHHLLETVQKGDHGQPGSTSHQTQWLNALQSELAPKKAKKSSKPKRRTAALTFLIEPLSDGSLKVGFGKIKYLTDGSPRIENYNLNPNIRNKVPAYFQEGDQDITIAFQQSLPKAPQSPYQWQDNRVLKGPLAKNLLPRLLKSERLFLLEEFQETGQYENLPPFFSEGPEIDLSYQWERDQAGNCRPTVGLPEGSQLIEIDGPYYLDAKKHQLGAIKHAPDQSLALLKLWQEGPIVSPEAAIELSSAMEKANLSPIAPRPITLEEQVLEHSGPKPIFTLFRFPVLSHYSQETWAGLQEIEAPPLTIGVLSFQYGEQELPHLKKTPKFSKTIQGNHILVIKRDAKAEARYLASLKDIDLVKISPLFPKHQIHPEHQESFIPNTDLVSCDLIWAHHMAQNFPQLEAEGWQIRMEESFDLKLTRADELFTDFTEDSDKGIDWFQFEAGLTTCEGQRMSLMELIAGVLRSDPLIPEDEELNDEKKAIVSNDAGNEFFELPAKRFFRIVRSVRDLFNRPDDGLHRLEAAKIAQELALDDSQTMADLRALGEQLAKKEPHQPEPLPKAIKADLRDYQKDGFQWLQFLARHYLHGILADDMGLGKTLQTLTHLVAEIESQRHEGKPSLVVAPTSVVPNWEAEIAKFAPSIKALVLHGTERKNHFADIDAQDIVVTSYALLQRDIEEHEKHRYHFTVLDEAQYIKNPKAKVTIAACQLDTKHRLCLSGTPMENHLGELWSLSRFLMPGLLGKLPDFNASFRNPIERHNDTDAQRSLNNKVGSLILRRTKDQVVEELPPKTEIIHHIALNKAQQDLYESVRMAMDKKVREAIADKGLARSQIVVLDALLKLRQICCHPQLIKTEAAQKATNSAKLDFLTELLTTLVEEGRRILLFSQFTTMLTMIEKHLKKEKIKFVKITGATRDRKTPVEKFQQGEIPIFLISLKAGGTGLNLTAADTVIHYDPWWNPAAENQATDRAHRIGQKNPVFVHKLITEGSIEERIAELQERKSKLVEALLSEKTNKLQLDTETLQNLLAPLD